MIDIPKIKDLYEQIIADLESEFSVSISLVGKVFLRAMAAVQAGKLRLFYLALGLVQKNIFPDTADPEAIGGTLERFGRVKLNRNPFPAIAGEYMLTVTGSIGAVLKASTVFKSNDDSTNPGKLYILDSQFTLTAISEEIPVRSLESGTGSTLYPGDKLTATAPIPLVDSLATLHSETVAATDAETTAIYRKQVLNSFRLSPQGGASSDYILWAQDVPGVNAVYPYAKSGAPNEINLYVEATGGNPVPTSGMLEDVEDVIEMDPDNTLPDYERGRRPLGVHQIHYLPVSVKEIDINISGFVGISSAIQTLIYNEMKKQIDLIRPFIAGAGVLQEKNDILDINRIISIILSVRPGSVFGTVTMHVDGVEMNSYTFDNGAIPVLDDITYV